MTMREFRQAIDLLTRRLDRLEARSGGTAVDPAKSAQWLQVRAVLMNALVPYPDARMAVVDALFELNRQIDANGEDRLAGRSSLSRRLRLRRRRGLN